jgi:glutamyl-Q tRNA(Asp) synthetase
MKNVVTRFAPSPTGRLHLGHAYSALLAHDFARRNDGMFLLRIEDIDPGRSRAEFVDGIIEDIEWLGMMPDGEILYQSERLHLYAQALERLKEKGSSIPASAPAPPIAARSRQRYGAARAGRAALSWHLPSPRNAGALVEDGGAAHAWRLDVATPRQWRGR